MLILALALGVSACGGSGGGGGLPPPPPAAPLEDTFGAGFGATFRADPNSNPRDPAAGDIVPVDPTKDATGVP
ncbi:MAG: hypothetical protein H7124_09075 [Phycisphaerales bacterium]|nr:hypothetical protein [Hyphomonadaceae bacterium]